MHWKVCKSLQKFALRMRDSSYDEQLANTELPSLKARRTQTRLCHLFKTMYGLTQFVDARVHHQ